MPPYIKEKKTVSIPAKQFGKKKFIAEHFEKLSMTFQ